MTGFGADEDEMRFFTRLSEREIDSVLAGKDPSGDGELQAVAAFFRDARAVLEETSTPAAETAHLTAIFAAAREPAAVSVPALSRPAAARRGKRFSPLAARVSIAAAVVAALAALGGAAAAGLLPAPVQRTVSDIARHVGISLPHSSHHAEHGGSGNQGGAPKGGNQPGQSQTNGDETNGDQTNGGPTNGDQTNGDQTNGDQGNRDQSSGNSGSGDSGSGDSGSGDSGSGGSGDGGTQGNSQDNARTTTDQSTHGDSGGQGSSDSGSVPPATPSGGDSGTNGDSGNGAGTGDQNG